MAAPCNGLLAATLSFTLSFRTPVAKHVQPVKAGSSTECTLMLIRPSGDLEGGRNHERNAHISVLEELFFKSFNQDEGSRQPNAAMTDHMARLGRYNDVPIVRLPTVCFPHQQVLLDMREPQYTLLFKSLLSRPPPWYYLHLFLPGGTKHLNDGRYSLPQDDPQREAGRHAALCGTVMQVVDVLRHADSRLAVIAQGVGRAVVVRATQTVPYARADVQWHPDLERLSTSPDSAPASWRQMLRATTCAQTKARVLMAAAVAEDAAWRTYEFESVKFSLASPPPLCKLNSSAADQAVHGVRGAVASAVRKAVSSSAALPRDFFGECPIVDRTLKQALSRLDSCPSVTQVDPVATAGMEAGEHDADPPRLRGVTTDVAALLEAEKYAWYQVNVVLTRAAQADGDHQPARVRRQLLSLLPPEYEDMEFPADFVLPALAKAARLHVPFAHLAHEDPYVDLHSSYPVERRAHILSYALLLGLREEGVDVQHALEAVSTHDRLLLAAAKLLELNARF